MKTRKAQIEMVDWALVRRRFELLLLMTELLGLEDMDEFGDEEEEGEEEKSLFFSTMAELLL